MSCQFALRMYETAPSKRLFFAKCILNFIVMILVKKLCFPSQLHFFPSNFHVLKLANFDPTNSQWQLYLTP